MVTPILVLEQSAKANCLADKTRLYSNTGIASTACVMTQGKIASTAYGHPQAEFSQIFPYGISVKIGSHKGNPPYNVVNLSRKSSNYKFMRMQKPFVIP